MTYRHFLYLLALAAISAAAVPLSAHNGDRLFPIRYLSEQTLARLDLNDGSVEDWVDAVGEPTFTPIDFNLLSGRDFAYDQFDPSNLDFRIWVGWSEDGRIHIAGEFADDVYVNEYDPRNDFNDRIGSHDNMGFQVDGDHTGGEYYFRASHNELDKALKMNRQAQSYAAIARAPSGPMVGLPNTTDTLMGFEELDLDKPVDWMVQPPFARGGGAVFSENPTFWLVEFFATCFDHLDHLSPEESAVSQFSEGKVIGFSMFVYDYDVELSGSLGFYQLIEPDGDWDQASDFGDGLLLGPGGESVDSSVQSVSWARIKASLEIDLRSKDSPPGQD